MSIPNRGSWPLALFCAVLTWQLPAPAARAQAATPAPATGTTSSRPDALWRCQLPGGVYLVALRSIASISSHEYIVDAAARVTEVTVATNSTVEARFYYLEPVTNGVIPSAASLTTLQEMHQHAMDAVTGQTDADAAVWQKVVKNYPTTTHAHTVEYRLSSKENLTQLYQSLEQAWTSGKGSNLTSQ